MVVNNISVNVELESRSNKNGLHKIYIRLTENRRHTRKYSGIDVTKEQFKKNARVGEWVIKHPDAALYNDTLLNTVQQAKRIKTESQNDGIRVSKEVVSYELSKGDAKKDFFSFWDQSVKLMLNYNTSKGYDTTKNVHLLPFFEKKGFDSIDFRELSPTLLTEFENELISKGLDSDSVHTNMKRVKAIFNKAVKQELVEFSLNPFRIYSMPKVAQNNKERLKAAEVEKFKAVKLKQGSLNFNVQQAWLFSFYCAGIRVEDMLTMKVKNIQDDRLIYQMGKTGTLKSIKINSRTAAILKYYVTVNSKPEDFIFPFIGSGISKFHPLSREYKLLVSAQTTKLNNCLKDIAGLAGINKKITNHMSRHSFAEIAARKKGDLRSIKTALGHSSLRCKSSA